MEANPVKPFPFRFLVDRFTESIERLPTIKNGTGFLRGSHRCQSFGMKRDPAPFLAFDAGNPQLIGRFEMAPFGVKYLADAQKGIEAKREGAVQMTIHVVTRIDGKELGSFCFGQIPADKFGLGYFEVFERINGEPIFLSAEAAKRSQDAKRKALAARIVTHTLEVSQPVVDSVFPQLLDRSKVQMADKGFQMPAVQTVGARFHVFPRQESFERSVDVSSLDRLSGSHVASVDGHLASVLLRERLACSNRMDFRMAAAIFIAPAAVPFGAAPENPVRGIGHWEERL